MTWLNSFFGGSTAANLIAITVGLVLVLLGLFWVFRKIAGSNSIRGTKSRRPRLGVTEAAIVDDKRRLVLVRRDNVEHLVMIGGASDVLVESNIVRVQPATSAAEPIRAIVTPDKDDVPVQSEPPQSEKVDVRDDVPPRGVGALASGAAATAAVVASIETALSKADDAQVDDVDDSEFTDAVADTLAKAAKFEETIAEDVGAADEESKNIAVEIIDVTEKADAPETGSISDHGTNNVKSETIKTVTTASEGFGRFADAMGINADKIESSPELQTNEQPKETPPAVDNVTDAKPLDAQMNNVSNEPDDVEIKMESITEPDEIQEEKPSTDIKDTVKAPEVTPPFEGAAAVSHEAPAKSSDEKPKEARSDDMEDEMQKLLSELAGERR